jgi:hypothetical protein
VIPSYLKQRAGQRALPLVEVNQAILAWSFYCLKKHWLYRKRSFLELGTKGIFKIFLHIHKIKINDGIYIQFVLRTYKSVFFLLSYLIAEPEHGKFRNK